MICETLDVVPGHWFVKQTVREKLACRDCAAITEPPAPSGSARSDGVMSARPTGHVIPRGRIGASLLAMILVEKYGAHQPLNRQSERYAREDVALDLSTIGSAARSAGGMSAELAGRLRRPLCTGTRRRCRDRGALPSGSLAAGSFGDGSTARGRWAHARRKFYDLARAGRAPPAPLAVEAARRIDAISAQEREINGRPAATRRAWRRAHVAPIPMADR